MSNDLKPYSIFVHCVSSELTEIRDRIRAATEKADHHPLGHGSENVDDQELRRRILTADVYACIFFGAQCQMMQEDIKRDCRWATDSQKPVMLLAVGECSEESRKDLEKFVEYAPGGSVFREIREPDPTLSAYVYLALLSHTVRTLDRARDGLETTAYDRDRPNRFVRRFNNKISRWPVLDNRCEKNARLKETTAEFFWDCFWNLLNLAGVTRLFFESGSSISFLSESFARRLEEQWKPGMMRFNVETNNILSCLELVLLEPVTVTLYPAGPAETKYGATFGDLRSVQTPAELGPIPPAVRQLVDEVRRHFVDNYAEGLIFHATSGIELSPNAEYQGPHVGSYPNMLFKRAILESGCPVVLFVDESKLPYPFISGRCFPICDGQFTWAEACQNKPLALACAFKNVASSSEVLPKLDRLGFRIFKKGRPGEVPWPLIVCNERFEAVHKRWGA